MCILYYLYSNFVKHFFEVTVIYFGVHIKYDNFYEKEVIHFLFQQDEDALIQLEDNSTHVVCNADEKLRTKLRNIVLKCLKKF